MNLFIKKKEVSPSSTVKENNKHGFIFACTRKSEAKMLSEMVVVTNKSYANKLFSVKEGDYVLLYNLDTDILYGTFTPASEPVFDNNIDLFDGKYPYYMRVKPIGKIHKLSNASNLFKKLGFSWRDILTEYGALLLKSFIEGVSFVKVKSERIVDDTYIPPIFSTTLWDFSYQSYGVTKKGNNKYPGVTPAFIIYNLVWRYTEPGDLVCDPMAGSGTTVDVCMEEKRRVVAFDIVPTRKDIIQADARALPLKDSSVDMIFIDSPYGDNIRYNDHPLNIGHIPATSEKFYDELEKVMQECYRVLKNAKVLAWL
ncbi:MAG: DNA methyltransferase [Aquificaceae bacterium]|nr:DNA methyltransferase [Aquificaceae bacterium]